MIKTLLLAFSFLTTIPVRIKDPIQPGDLGKSAAWFPLIGILIGFITAGTNYILSLVFSTWISAALTVLVWTGLTGGLHLDGLADCCDGLFVQASRERRLEILKDSRLGSFGAIGLTLFLILKVAAIASLSQPWSLVPFILAGCISRWLILPAARFPSAREDGLGRIFATGLNLYTYLIGIFFPVLLSVLSGLPGIFALGFAHMVTCVILVFARSRIGGVTGDVFGLIVEVGELIVLLTFSSILQAF